MKKRKKIIQEKKKEQSDRKEAIVKEQATKLEFPLGATAHFASLTENMQLSREEIKAKVKEVNEDIEVVYIDFQKGDQEGFIRFAKENNAADFVKGLGENGELEIGDEVKLKLRVLEGEEEEKHLKKTSEEIVKRRQHMKQNKGGQKRKGNYKHGGRNSKSVKKE